MSARRAALATLAAGGLAACNAIFGVDSFVVSGPTGGAPATTSSSGGARGTGGSGGGPPTTSSASATSSSGASCGQQTCSPDEICMGGVCTACPAGQTACGGACVDQGNNPLNCGACGTICASGVCGTTLSASMATAPALWSFNQSAYYDAAAMVGTLTAAVNDVGTIVYKNAIETDTFMMRFDFRIVGTMGEGMAFMIETTGSNAVGTGNGGLGVSGLTGYAFELDTFKSSCGDPNANHIGIDALTPCMTGPKGGPPTALTTNANPTFPLAGAGWHTCEVDFMNGTVTMQLDEASLILSFVIPGWSSGQPYYFGFGGDSGSKAVTHQVRNVILTFPTPRCL